MAIPQLSESTIWPGVPDVQGLNRDQMLRVLYDEIRSQASWIAVYDETVAERLGLTATDQRCLELVLQAKYGLQSYTLTPGELAHQCHLTRGAVTGVLDRLEAAGLVRREHDTRDRRRIFIQPMTEHLSGEVEAMLHWLESSFGDVCADYSDEQVALLIDFARRLQTRLQTGSERLRRRAMPGLPSRGMGDSR
jgi:DNA-binding MarR family transcriptional regulator